MAGKPSTREIATAIRNRDDLPGTLSHEGVGATLRGAGGLPRWPNLESLVRVLADRTITRGDSDAAISHIHTLWLEADAEQALGARESSSADAVHAIPPKSGHAVEANVTSRNSLDASMRAMVGLFSEINEKTGTIVALLRDGGVEMLASSLVADGDSAEADLLIEASTWPLGEVMEAVEDSFRTENPELLQLISSAWRPVDEIVQFVGQPRQDVNHRAIHLLVLFVALWRPVRDVVRLLYGLRVNGHDVESRVVLHAGACRSIAEVVDLVKALQRSGGNGGIREVCMALTRRPLQNVLEVVRELRNANSGAAADSILWHAAWGPVDGIPTLLAVLRDEGRDQEAEHVVKAAAWRSARDVFDLVETLRQAGRNGAADQVLDAVTRAPAEHVVELVLLLRWRGRDEEVARLLASARSEGGQERDVLADALDSVGLQTAAESLRW
ncbi:hypothetical protein [Streptomyces sp. NPDC090053]|uniref:hypothetical protein n=1 Tax=Streptomyces sp. NPDC090053 TaxID=3365932 RepID=UPI0037FE39A6